MTTEFGERLRSARERAGLTVYALAQRTGVSQSAIAEYERGVRYPVIDTAMTLAAVLGVTLDDLAGPLPELPEYSPPARGRRPKSEEKAQ